MAVVIFLVVLGSAATGLSIFCFHKHEHVYDDWGAGGRFFAVAAAGLFVSSGIVVISHNLNIEASRKECEAIADGRDAKFVEYNYFSWNCLVKSTKGRYIPLSDVSKIELEQDNG